MKILSIIILWLIPLRVEAMEYERYVGGGVQSNSIDTDEEVTTGLSYDALRGGALHAGEMHMGVRMNEHMGLEAGYQYSAKGVIIDAPGVSLIGDVLVHGPTVDMLGYLPVTERLELIGSAGVSYLVAETWVPGKGGSRQGRVGGRVGLGAQYWLEKDMNVRGLVRYQSADFDSVDNSAVVGNVYLNFQY